MEAITSKLKRCVLVTAEGRIDSSTAPKLQSVLNEVIDDGNYKLVLDLAKVDFISSAGLWVLVNAQKKCKRFNRGEVVLTSLAKRTHDAFELAGFIPYFKIFDDTAQAVGSF
jgi:anti-sigma B factor antagonist